MSENLIENLIESIVNNWKKYFGCVLGFIVGITIMKYGIVRALIIFLFAFIGYKLGDKAFTRKIKKNIMNRLKED
ncbi:MAG: DUF2273 domain-containing protein [Fusobacterium sp.]|nr:DUF2273 domain-containing protein [Fusobacterium sp.]